MSIEAITDEMVEAARQAYVKEFPETALYPSQFAMRAAVTAALSHSPVEPGEPAPENPLVGVEQHMDAARDIGTLLAQLDALQEATGESLEAEDAAVVAQIREAWGGNSAGPNGPVTGNHLREILGIEPEDGLDPDGDGNIQTCAGSWVKNTDNGLWAFEEDEDD